MRKEIELTKEVQIEFGHGATRLFRNNTGKLQDPGGRWVQFGLCVGSSDLIGWTSVVITPEMVGRTVAVFTAIETKGERTRTTPEQFAFIDTVQLAGGKAGIVRTVEEAERVIHAI